MTPPTFNLIDEPWIRVRRHDSEIQLMSIREALANASVIKALAGEIPTQDAALLRLLLAILLGSVRPDHERNEQENIDLWASWWEAGRFPDGVLDYLTGVHSRFDLLDADAPFYQVAGLTTASGKASGLGKLIAEVPDGEPYFTTRTREEVTSLSLAEAARWLVHCMAFDPSGIKSGAVGDDRVKGGKGYPFGYPAWAGNLGLVVAEADTLFETLLFNLPLAYSGPEDLPLWDRAPVGPGVDETHPEPHGPADLFTWPSRRLRLFTHGARVTDAQVSNGDKLGPQNADRHEPMTAWRYSKNQSKGGHEVVMPVLHQASRRIWQGLGSILVASEGGARAIKPRALEWLALLSEEGILAEDRTVDLHVVGFEYGPQNSVITGAIDDRLAGAVVAFTNPVLAQAAVVAAEAASEGVKALANLASNLDRAKGGDGEAPRHDTYEQGYALLDLPYRRWLRDLVDPADVEATQAAWWSEARRILTDAGDRLIRDAGPAAWVGRTVTQSGSDAPRLVDAGIADIWFRAALAKALPLPARQATKEIA